MKAIIKNSLFQLLIVYTILVTLANFSFISRYIIHFEIFALILAIFAIFTLKENDNFEIKQYFILLPLFLIIITRAIPFLFSKIPLGYDVGIYKYAFDIYQSSLPNIPYQTTQWFTNTFPLGFAAVIDTLTIAGFNTSLLLTIGLIFLEILLGLALYITTKKLFNKEIAFFSLLLFSVSIAQFKTFSYFYYKNIIALIFLLIAFYLLKSKKYIPFVLVSVMIGSIHQPTFLLFALIAVIYSLINYKELKYTIPSGIAIILLTLPFYIDRLKELILDNIQPIITANIGAGTFITFLQYQFLSIAYLPFAALGFFYLIKKKDYTFALIWFIINFIIVFFQLIFFNRFIIHLDIIFIITAGIGIFYLIKDNKKLGYTIAIILLLSATFLTLKDAAASKPLITEENLKLIQSLQNTEQNSYVMATSSSLSPWVLGYSGRETIAPGLFDLNKWDLEQWKRFWSANNYNDIRDLMLDYSNLKPMYIVAYKGQLNLNKFNDKCFSLYDKTNNLFIYKLEC